MVSFLSFFSFVMFFWFLLKGLFRSHRGGCFFTACSLDMFDSVIAHSILHPIHPVPDPNLNSKQNRVPNFTPTPNLDSGPDGIGSPIPNLTLTLTPYPNFLKPRPQP